MSAVVGRRFRGFTSKLSRYVLVAGLFSAAVYFYVAMFLYFSQ